MTDPAIYPYASDDGCPEPENLDISNVIDQENIYFLSPGEGALFIYTPINFITYEVHSCVLPIARGQSVDLASKSIRFMFTVTNCRKIITWVPEDNHRARNLALKCGFKFEGISSKSWLKNNKLTDLYLFGLVKEV